MSQIIKNSSGGGGGAVDSVSGTNGVTASPTTGAVIVSGVEATTTTVGVASFSSSDFNVSIAGAVSLANPPPVVNYESPQIDFNVLGPVKLFTTASSGNYFPFKNFICVVDLATALVGNCVFSIGTNNPNYDNYLTSAGFSTAATTGTFNNVFDSSGAYTPFFTPLTDVYVNVLIPDGGTDLKGTFIFSGVYA